MKGLVNLVVDPPTQERWSRTAKNIHPCLGGTLNRAFPLGSGSSVCGETTLSQFAGADFRLWEDAGVEAFQQVVDVVVVHNVKHIGRVRKILEQCIGFLPAQQKRLDRDGSTGYGSGMRGPASPSKARIQAQDLKKIIALDGGGIRGMITVEVLAEIENLLCKKLGRGDKFRLADYFVFVAGTILFGTEKELGWS